MIEPTRSSILANAAAHCSSASESADSSRCGSVRICSTHFDLARLPWPARPTIAARASASPPNARSTSEGSGIEEQVPEDGHRSGLPHGLDGLGGATDVRPVDEEPGEVDEHVA